MTFKGTTWVATGRVLIFLSLFLSPASFFIFFPSNEIVISESLETQTSKENSGLLYKATITYHRWFLYTTAGGAQKFLYRW